MRVVADRLSLRWYLGYDLTEPLPDHSSLTRIRERYGLEVFRRFFEAIVEQCLAAGLVWGKELYIDATKVEANAALDSLQPRFAVEAHLARLFAAAEDDGDGGDGRRSGRADGGDAPARLPVALTEEAQRRARPSAPLHRHDWIGRGRSPRPRRRRAAPTGARPTSASAPPIPTPRRCRYGDGRTHLGYQDHYVVDGGKARIILAALVDAGRGAGEPAGARPALAGALPLEAAAAAGDRRHQVRHGREHRRHRAASGSAPTSRCRRSASGPGMFGEHGLRLRRGRRHLPLPRRPDAALPLASATRRSGGSTRRRRRPAAPARSAPQCTTSQRGRRVGRSFDEAYLDRVRGYHATEPYAKAMRKRQVWVEPLFAEAKDWHGLRRFRLRGLEKVNGEALLIAAGQNLKRLLSRRGWGRRPFPSGAAGVVLALLRPPLAAVRDRDACQCPLSSTARHQQPFPFINTQHRFWNKGCPVDSAPGGPMDPRWRARPLASPTSRLDSIGPNPGGIALVHIFCEAAYISPSLNPTPCGEKAFLYAPLR